MQPLDFSPMKFAVLTSLSECANSSRLPHGLVEDLLYYVFFLCVNCREHLSIAINQFTLSEKEQLKTNLLIFIPRLESNLEDTFGRFGTESGADFRRVRSGLQFLQDDIASQLDNPKLNAKMTDLLRSEFVKEIDRRLTHWKQNQEWDQNEHLDLRFVPASHDWYLGEQREVSRQKYDTGKMNLPILPTASA